MTTFLVICVVIVLLTLPARIGARRRRALERQAILRRLAGPRTIIVQIPTPRNARVDDGRLSWGPAGSSSRGVSS